MIRTILEGKRRLRGRPQQTKSNQCVGANDAKDANDVNLTSGPAILHQARRNLAFSSSVITYSSFILLNLLLDYILRIYKMQNTYMTRVPLRC